MLKSWIFDTDTDRFIVEYGYFRIGYWVHPRNFFDKTLFSRNFCQKRVRVNVRNFLTLCLQKFRENNVIIKEIIKELI